MTVLVTKLPQPRYQSIGETGSTPEELEKARKLDHVLETRIRRLVEYLAANELMPSGATKASLLTYWNVGKALRDVTKDRELFNDAELPLLWRATKMYVPEELLYKERGPYREHLWYCYRLAFHDKKTAQKMNWGEWVTIFDSPSINQEPRFDTWFSEKLRTQKHRITRSELRVFVPCVNALLGDIDIPELDREELFNCYEVAWQLMKQSESRKTKGETHATRKQLQDSIERLLGQLDRVMCGELTPEAYATRVIELACGA